MADAIGSVRATFTASAGGMLGAVDQIVGKLGAFAAATKRTQAQTADYTSVVSRLGNQFAKGDADLDTFVQKIGNVQGKFRGLSEAERAAAALQALRNASMMGGASADQLAAAEQRLLDVVRSATPPLERLSIDLAKNRADFISNKKSVEDYRNTIATLPGQINGTETAAAKMERVFKQAQETVRGLRAPTAEYEDRLTQLNEQLEAGFIDDQQYAAATAEVKAKLAELSPEGIAAAAAAEQLSKAMSRGAAVTQEFLTPQEQFATNMAELDSLLERGAISEDTFARASAAARAKLSEQEEALRASTPEAKALAEAMDEGRRVTESMLSPTERYEQEINKLDALLAKGAISEETYARATKRAKDEMDRATPAAKSLGDAFGGLPGPIGAAARALDVMQKSLASTAGGFKGGIGAGISNFVSQIRSGIANAGSTGGASLVGIAPQIGLIAGAGFAAVRGLQALTGALAGVGEEVERTEQLARRLGVSFQEYEILKVAAQQAGVEVEALAGAQTKGLKAINAAREGSKEQAKAFAELGVTQEQLNNTEPSQLLEQVAAKLNAIEDPATRAALAMKIFGKSGNEILPALANLEATRAGIERLGGSMSQVDVSRFSAMDDAFDKVAVAGSRLGKTLLAPFTELFTRIANGVAAVAGGLSKAFAPIGNLFAEIGGAIGLVVERLGESLGVALRVVGALLQLGGITAIAAAIGAQVDQVSRAFAAMDSFIQPIIEGLEQVAAFVSDNITRAITAIYTIFGNLVASTVEWVGQSNLLTGLFEGLSGAATMVYDAFAAIGGWVTYVVEQLEYWAGIEPKAKVSPADAEAIEAQAKAAEDAAKEEEKRAKQAEQRAAQIKEGLLSPYEKMQQAIAEINDLEQRGLLTAEQRAAQEAKIRDEFAAQDPLAQQAKKTAEEQKKAAEGIAQEIEKSAKAGQELGAAADPIRSAFQSTAEAIKAQVEAGLISPEDAKKQMAEAVDAMNDELKRLGDDQKFAEKIRDGLKSEIEKVQEELDAIDKNQTLTDEEKAKAKEQVKSKFAGGLPGEAEKDAADKFREGQKKLKDALDAGLIDPEQFKERQARLAEEMQDSVSDLKDKQERNKNPDRRAVGAVDVNSSEGASTFFRILRGQDDPTKKQLVELQKQTRLLERVAEAEAEVVQI